LPARSSPPRPAHHNIDLPAAGNRLALAPVEHGRLGAVPSSRLGPCRRSQIVLEAPNSRIRPVPEPPGLAFIAAAIIRLTSPETACRPSRKGSVANIQRSRPPAPQPDVPALVAPRRHGSRAETRSRLSLIGDRSRWLPVGTDPRRGQKGSSNDAPSPRSRPRLVRGTERCQAGENTAHQAEIIDAIARDQRRSSEAGDLIR
jgi:hypothetical protein